MAEDTREFKVMKQNELEGKEMKNNKFTKARNESIERLTRANPSTYHKQQNKIELER